MKRRNMSSNKSVRRKYRRAAGRRPPDFLPRGRIVMPDETAQDAPPIPADEDPPAQEDAPRVHPARVRCHRQRAAKGTMRDARGHVVELR